MEALTNTPDTNTIENPDADGKPDVQTDTPLKRLTVTMNEAAEITGLSYGTIYNLLNSGALTRLKSGKRVLIRYSEIEDYINGLSQVA